MTLKIILTLFIVLTSTSCTMSTKHYIQIDHNIQLKIQVEKDTMDVLKNWVDNDNNLTKTIISNEKNTKNR